MKLVHCGWPRWADVQTVRSRKITSYVFANDAGREVEILIYDDPEGVWIELYKEGIDHHGRMRGTGRHEHFTELLSAHVRAVELLGVA